MTRCYAPAEDYLPHAAPMVLLERVIAVGDESAHCQVSVASPGILAPFLTSQGALPAWFAIELMAQTVGVWSGWHASQQGNAPGLGLLLGARELKCTLAEFPAGSVLDIKVKMLLCDEKISSFEGVILMQGENNQVQIAQARLTTYQPNADEIITLTQGAQE